MEAKPSSFASAARAARASADPSALAAAAAAARGCAAYAACRISALPRRASARAFSSTKCAAVAARTQWYAASGEAAASAASAAAAAARVAASASSSLAPSAGTSPARTRGAARTEGPDCAAGEATRSASAATSAHTSARMSDGTRASTSRVSRTATAVAATAAAAARAAASEHVSRRNAARVARVALSATASAAAFFASNAASRSRSLRVVSRETRTDDSSAARVVRTTSATSSSRARVSSVSRNGNRTSAASGVVFAESATTRATSRIAVDASSSPNAVPTPVSAEPQIAASAAVSCACHAPRGSAASGARSSPRRRAVTSLCAAVFSETRSASRAPSARAAAANAARHARAGPAASSPRHERPDPSRRAPARSTAPSRRASLLFPGAPPSPPQARGRRESTVSAKRHRADLAAVSDDPTSDGCSKTSRTRSSGHLVSSSRSVPFVARPTSPSMSSAAAPAQHSAKTASAPATVAGSFPGPHRSRSTSSHSFGRTNAPNSAQHCATVPSTSAARDAAEFERVPGGSDVFDLSSNARTPSFATTPSRTRVALSRLVAAHTSTNARHSRWQCCVAFSSRKTRLARRSSAARTRASSCHPVISAKIGFTAEGKLFFTRTRAPSPGRAANGGGYVRTRGSERKNARDDAFSEAIARSLFSVREPPRGLDASRSTPKCSGAYVTVAFRSFSCSFSYCAPSAVSNASAASRTAAASSATADMTYGSRRGS